MAAATAVPVFVATSAFAQASTAEAVQNFDIPDGDLTEALRAFASATGGQLVYSSEIVQGLHTNGVRGSMSRTQALTQLLAGTGLTFRVAASGAITIERAGGANGERVLGAVRVEGAQDGSYGRVGQAAGVNGINGSRDITATEGTGSYTSGALTIGSKAPQSIKDIPQSVSVVTQQRMQDQKLTDLMSTLNQAAGITLVQGADSTSRFFSRGFEIRSFQIDGGAPITTRFSFSPLIDMAQYDHVEVLRGADGLFSGYGDPSGTVNLVRKRPLDHAQVLIEGAAGSWSDYRAVIDATSPLGFAGKVRGRLVVTYQDRNYFYDTANDDILLLYGIVEADVTPTTILSLGGSFNRRNALPWIGGLPRYSDGEDLNLPRSTCLCVGWGRSNFETTEIFSQIEKNLSGDFKFNLKLTRVAQNNFAKFAYVSGAINPNTGLGASLIGNMSNRKSTQYLADATLNGDFKALGQRQEIVLGANYQHDDSGGYENFDPLYPFPYPAVDIFQYDPDAYPEPGATAINTRYPEQEQKQWGVFATLKLTLLNPLHITTGIRWSGYKFIELYQSIEPEGAVSFQLRNTYSGHNLSPPHVAVNYDITDNWTAYASYTSIYISQANFLDKDNRPLDPTTGSNVEAGVKGSINDTLNISLAAYHIEQKKVGVYDPSIPYESNGSGISCCYYIGDETRRSYGIEAEAVGQIMPGWQISASYTFNRNKIRGNDASEAGKFIHSYTPKHLLKLWTSYTFAAGELAGLSLGAGVNAQSKHFIEGSVCTAFAAGDPESCQTFTPFAFTQDSYALLSARVAYQIGNHWSIALNAENLTSHRYYQTMGGSSNGNWYGEPRSATFTLRGRF